MSKGHRFKVGDQIRHELQSSVKGNVIECLQDDNLARTLYYLIESPGQGRVLILESRAVYDGEVTVNDE